MHNHVSAMTKRSAANWAKYNSRLMLAAILIGLGMLAASARAQSRPATQSQPAATAPTSADRDVNPPSLRHAIAPRLTTLGDAVYLTWLEKVPPEFEPGVMPELRNPPYRLRICRFVDGRWAQPQTIAQGKDLLADPGDVSALAQAQDGTLLACWLSKTAQNPNHAICEVMLARSTDGGRTWTALGALPNHSGQIDHGYVSLVAEPSAGKSAVRAFWLETPAAGHDRDPAKDGFADSIPAALASQLHTTLIDQTIGPDQLLDDKVCDRCAIDAGAAGKGPIVVYRDRSSAEIRDIAMLRRTNEGAWPADSHLVYPDEWMTLSADMNGPAIDTQGDQMIVAWYTGAKSHARVEVTFSSDGGTTFSKPIELDSNKPLGRVSAVLDRDGTGVVCWLADNGSQAVIRLARIVFDGLVGPPVTVAVTGRSRAVGIPTIAPVKGGILVVWTQDGTPTILRAVLQPLSGT